MKAKKAEQRSAFLSKLLSYLLRNVVLFPRFQVPLEIIEGYEAMPFIIRPGIHRDHRLLCTPDVQIDGIIGY